mmetsp:Transcript_11685/g.14103  ORF Transcript_11685/g.14103 Transcript_11685/m.14103 type:complete len:218 (+) Transcript_11685:4107-4760(+)
MEDELDEDTAQRTQIRSVEVASERLLREESHFVVGPEAESTIDHVRQVRSRFILSTNSNRDRDEKHRTVRRDDEDENGLHRTIDTPCVCIVNPVVAVAVLCGLVTKPHGNEDEEDGHEQKSQIGSHHEATRVFEEERYVNTQHFYFPQSSVDLRHNRLHIKHTVNDHEGVADENGHHTHHKSQPDSESSPEQVVRSSTLHDEVLAVIFNLVHYLFTR